MASGRKAQAAVTQLDEGDWLYRLLADIHRDVAMHPSPQTVERIRARLAQELKTPARAAA